jgi:N-acetylmuramoyl-L-alanine amidase
MRPVLAACLALAACAGDVDQASRPDGGGPGEDAGPTLDAGPFRSVEDVADEDCATVGVRGLALQISEAIRCEDPGALVEFAEGPKLEFTGSNVVPYLVPGAASALTQVTAQVGATIRVNSAFRTVAEQLLLSIWADQGRCNIAVAATPGRSNHESGRALDVSNYGEVESAMNAHGWSRNVPNDPVHYEYLAGADLRGRDVAAFQALWNANHPGDQLVVDGEWGAATEERLRASPAEGFAVDLCDAARVNRLRLLERSTGRAVDEPSCTH